MSRQGAEILRLATGFRIKQEAAVNIYEIMGIQSWVSPRFASADRGLFCVVALSPEGCKKLVKKFLLWLNFVFGII